MFRSLFYPLHAAAGQGDVARIASLLARGADLDRRDSAGCTPLMYAARSGMTAAARLLLEAGTKIELQTDLGASALWFSCHAGHVEMAQFLLAHGADPDQSFTVRPVRISTGTRKRSLNLPNSDPEIQKSLRAGVAAALESARLGVPNALAAAAMQGHDGVVAALLAAGADMNTASSRYGGTPLSYAVQRGHVGVVRLLVGYGADVELASTGKLTPLQLAASAEQLETARLLLEVGANPDAGEIAPLVFAITKRSLAMIDLLLQFGANPDLLLKTGAPISELALDKPEIQAILARHKQAYG